MQKSRLVLVLAAGMPLAAPTPDFSRTWLDESDCALKWVAGTKRRQDPHRRNERRERQGELHLFGGRPGMRSQGRRTR